MLKTVQTSFVDFNTSYEDVLRLQEEVVAKVIDGAPEQLMFVEHPPLYTAGTSANIETDVLGTYNFPVIKTGRGGQITYHGPGQRVLYPILDLKTRGRDIKKYICDLQKWIKLTLSDFGIDAHCDDEIGVWVGNKKIAAIGVRVRKWVTFHGVALNIDPDLDHYKGIIPCGIADKGVTSMIECGFSGTMEDVDVHLKENFKIIFDRDLD